MNWLESVMFEYHSNIDDSTCIDIPIEMMKSSIVSGTSSDPFGLIKPTKISVHLSFLTPPKRLRLKRFPLVAEQ